MNAKLPLIKDLPLGYGSWIFLDQNLGQYLMYFFADNRALCIQSLNESGKEKVKEFLIFNSGHVNKKEVHTELKKLFENVLQNPNDYNVLEDLKEVYWSRCVSEGNSEYFTGKRRGIPTKPIRSFELLKKWFQLVLDKRFQDEFTLMMDSGSENEVQFKTEFIKSQLNEVEQHLDFMSESKQSREGSELLERKESRVALKSFKVWLELKLIELENDRIPLPNEVDSDLEDYSKWSLPKKLILLNELGLLKKIRSDSQLGISDNELARIISKLIGGNADTIASGISAIKQGRRQDPYIREKNVSAVKDYLIERGLKLSK